MSLEHAILGFLNYRPSSGYDLKKIFDSSVRHFWPANQSQIYRTLAALDERGWVEMDVIRQSDRPDRKVYHLTDSGKQELARWLSAPPPMDEARSAPLVQVFFLGQLTDEEILAKFEGFAEMMRVILERYDQVPGRLEEHIKMVSSPREVFFWLLTLDLGVRTMHANLEWAESIIEQIKNGQVPDK